MRQKLAGWNGNPANLKFWRTVGEYLDRLDAGIGVNAAYLLPQGTIRALAMGLGRGRRDARAAQRPAETGGRRHGTRAPWACPPG